jgi:DNA-binding NtrC family response regulator
MSRIRSQAEIVAASLAPVLIQGGTGTGKEVLARFIHDKSDRRERPFIKVDCSALPRELIESELFGHEKGAFTGAVDRKTGRFEEAQGGTLFLDEVGNLARDTQIKLLNVLQDHAITRIGGASPVRLDIRVLCASNLNLEEMAASGAFREDLLFRINAITINLPPLSDRKEDIPELANFFLSIFNAANGKSIRGLTAGAFRKLYAYAWPGNVRELRNAIQRAVIFCGGSLIGPGHIELLSRATRPSGAGKARPHYHLVEMNRKKFLEIVRRHNGRVGRMARELGVSRQACYDNLKKYKINPEKYRK